ncbi:MAG: hypothetical protein LRY38_04585 [Aeromonadaceae bacterium]|nr:hypothetical protein [Aeromonadaceae bacterium]
MQPVPVISDSRPPALIALALRLVRGCASGLRQGLRRWWHLPRFMRHLVAQAPDLSLAESVPQVAGSPRLRLGRQCRLGAQVQILALPRQNGLAALLVLGDRVHIGHHSTLVLGQRIWLGDDVRIAAGSQLLSTPEDTAGIRLEEGVTLGTGCTVQGQVRIGRGTLVAPGSLVNTDLPAGVYAAGRPARALCLLAHPQE